VLIEAADLSKTFTLDEARTLLPVLGALLKRARDAAVRAHEIGVEMQALSQRIFLSGGMHVDVAAAARRRAEREKAMEEAKSTIEEIEEIGARVGELDEGRLEFPYLLDGREVLLCWNLGDEEDIRQWREDEDGSELRSVSDGMFRRDRERPN
jgi:hypothetical protein